MDRMNRLAAMADAEFRGPAFSAWPARCGGKLRPGTGGGGGDGGAAAQEAARQKQIDDAINSINNIFAGKDQTVVTDAATSYDPNATYYNADGTKYVAPTKDVQEAVNQVYDPSTGKMVSKPNNVNNNFGDAGGSDTYNPKNDPSLGHYENTGGDSDSTYWVPNPGISDDGSGNVYRDTVIPDADAINKAIQDGSLYTGTQTIKGVDRQSMYDEQRQAVTDLNDQDVNRQFADAEKQNRFGLARAGLSGGSEDIDSNAELTRRTNEGLVKAAGIGDQAASDLQTADEKTRQNLISMAESGVDTGQAEQLAQSQLAANTSAAQSAQSGATVGNLFGDLSNAYLIGQQRQGVQAGLTGGQSVFQPGISNNNPSQSYQGS